MKIEIYTDGSCSGNGKINSCGAYGYVILKNGQLINEGGKFYIDTTNNKMEMAAVIEGMRYTLDNDLNKKSQVLVYSDSQYLINGITSWIDGWKKKGWKTSSKEPVKNKELWEEMDTLKNKFEDISFIWVKGHENNEWNNYTDELCTSITKNNKYAR